MRSNLTIANIGGMPVIIHYTFIIMAIALSALQYVNHGAYSAAVVVYLFAILSISVLLHELGHVFAAKKFPCDTGY